MASLDGLVDEWESSKFLRGRMRTHKRLFLPEPGKSEALGTVACAVENYDAIKPLAMRLEFPAGVVGMIARPAIMKANLDRITALRLVKGFPFYILNSYPHEPHVL